MRTPAHHRLVVLALLSCGFAGSPLVAADASNKEKTPAKPKFVDGEAAKVPGFSDSDYWIRHDLWVETEFDSDEDGKPDRMHVDVTRPRQTDSEGLKLPVIYETSPYFAGTAPDSDDSMWSPRQELGATPTPRPTIGPFERSGVRPIISKDLVAEWVPRGFVVVHSSSPGTGLSEGCPTVGGENEALAPKAVIDWLCGRAKGFTTPDGDEPVTAYWSTGKVGMTGTSYNGTLPLAAATTGVEGLEAIIPVAPNTSYYHYYRSNGLVRHPGGYLGEDIDVLYDFIHSGNPELREHCDCIIREKTMLANIDRESGDYNDFWAGRDYLNQLDHVHAATLMSHGFNDWNVVPEHSYRISAALKKQGVPVQIYYHQDGHGGPPPMKMMNRWFTHYLFGVDNGVEKDPKSWIVREGKKHDEPTSYADYPNPDAAPVDLHLAGGAPQQGKLSLAEDESHGRETLVDNFSFDGEALAKADWTEHRLIYVSPELSKPVHLSGTASIQIRLACDRPATNLSVWLVSLPWTDRARGGHINDNLITRGWADPQNAESIRESKPLVPGEFVDIKFDLQPDDQIIPAGQKIGLLIMASDRDFTLWPDPGTKLTVDLPATNLTLPVVGGPAALEEAFTPKPTPEPNADKGKSKE
ncbi:Xaa-Pro dipeptidyl-peptidase [Allorhodopirellula heiligendammensis]|uniref:Xaa-Pro dipeptidyl-peptidase n=1 Tax=Allorhodopirellula heiligendammensis TaxID=2714739 RepID=A0A5C6C403_9BACT|nr:Xaa-Pro dipeptidyl-peptidase [Allorhodopirellula heiligendammensis]TWU18246.1 Xaa-Pro dipeptidyl-peptidase [Allorhodopirellula heiligendammensis]